MRSEKILILGAGLAGLTTAFFLKRQGIKSILFEQNAKVGGLCNSCKKKGFVFDYSGHLLHFRDPNIRNLVKDWLGANLNYHKRRAFVFFNNNFIPYPFQSNLKFLPKDLSEVCLKDFLSVKKSYSIHNNGDNFLNWMRKNFGDGICDNFMIPYNEKFWCFPLDQMSYRWAERFVVVPSEKDMDSNLNWPGRENSGYHSSFWYPKSGGIEQLPKAISDSVSGVNLNCKAKRLDIKNRQVVFNDGRKQAYDILVSTIPLPELGNISFGLSEVVKKAISDLKFLSIYNVNLGIESKKNIDKHWIYFSQENMPFFRVGFYNSFSDGCSGKKEMSLYVDFSYRGKNRITNDDIINLVRKKLREINIINSEDKVTAVNVNNIKYGYPIYDSSYSYNKKVIMDYLHKNNIITCGRYGSWNYSSMEDVMKEADGVSKKIGFTWLRRK